MSEALAAPRPSARRHRHRSPRRKVAESLLVMFGVPILLLVVLALSVELIEYQPVSASPSVTTKPRVEPTSTAPTRTPARIEISPLIEDATGTNGKLTLE